MSTLPFLVVDSRRSSSSSIEVLDEGDHASNNNRNGDSGISIENTEPSEDNEMKGNEESQTFPMEYDWSLIRPAHVDQAAKENKKVPGHLPAVSAPTEQCRAAEGTQQEQKGHPTVRSRFKPRQRNTHIQESTAQVSTRASTPNNRIRGERNLSQNSDCRERTLAGRDKSNSNEGPGECNEPIEVGQHLRGSQSVKEHGNSSQRARGRSNASSRSVSPSNKIPRNNTADNDLTGNIFHRILSKAMRFVEPYLSLQVLGIVSIFQFILFVVFFVLLCHNFITAKTKEPMQETITQLTEEMDRLRDMFHNFDGDDSHEIIMLENKIDFKLVKLKKEITQDFERKIPDSLKGKVAKPKPKTNHQNKEWFEIIPLIKTAMSYYLEIAVIVLIIYLYIRKCDIKAIRAKQNRNFDILKIRAELDELTERIKNVEQTSQMIASDLRIELNEDIKIFIEKEKKILAYIEACSTDDELSGSDSDEEGKEDVDENKDTDKD